jgi:L-iditol 2-dehydrogenase
LNDLVVVVGTGMIGLLVLQVLRAAGCGTLIAVDVEEEKLEMASQLGAQVILNPRECDVPSAIAALTQGRGVDLAFEVCGASETLKTAITSVRKGGTVTAIGNISPQVDLPLQSLVTRQIRLQGSCASCGEYPACLDLIASGRVNVDTLLSATAPLEEGAQWFQRLYHKEKGLMKVVLCP